MRTRAFSLIEVMVASVASLIVLAGAVSFATAMASYSRKLGDDQVLNARIELARQLFQSELPNVGYGWPVDAQAATLRTGAPGPGHCVASTGLCAADSGILPLTIVNSTSGPDALSVILPRDPDVDAVKLLSLSGGAPLPADCTSLTQPQTFDVQGETTAAWAAGDLVAVSRGGHVTVARVNTAFPADATSPPVVRQLVLDVGATNTLRFDDGGRALDASCSAEASLLNARVYRVKQLRLRVDTTTRSLEVAESSTAAEVASPTFLALLENVDDLQIQLELARFPSTGTASTCACNGSGVLTGAAFDATCTCTAGEVLNVDASAATVYRILGLKLALTMSGTMDVRPANLTTSGVFDRAGAVATDRKRRRVSTIYVGLPNAHIL